ncbi:DUF4328 domain-containing protein [Sphingomonas oryzagri]|uniref:DUF4328 domain-containing protein n=1 Tax=Sphingomonas oryzagri TaxID=3042314 RepID=A0ABT6N6H1_9SPHN|nr:DUF4328 domain-containing protein [Sphingomonas oryzagri]MDH7640698.1 DUF4328 domain-containing protein [Sphingomonas oryzagri]
MDDMDGVRDAVALGRHAVIWAFVWVVTKVIGAIIALSCALALHRLPADFRLDSAPLSSTAVTLVQAQAALSSLSLIAFVISAAIGCCWIYRMVKVTRVIGEGVSVTPGWSVGWFFIPVACLFRPFEGIKEAWQVTVNPADWPHVAVPTMLRVWWGLWLGLNFVDYFASMGPRIDPGIDGVELISWGLVASGAIAVALTIVWSRIVRSISRSQALLLNASAFR